MVAQVLFFKENGKFYAEEAFEFYEQDNVYNIVSLIKRKFSGRYNDMHMVILFSDDYEHGYPFMIPAKERQGWSIVAERNDELGSPTCWVTEVSNSSEYGKYVLITLDEDGRYNVEIQYEPDSNLFSFLDSFNTLKEAKHWVDSELRE